MDPLGAITDSRECVKLDDLVPWQKSLEITEYRAMVATQHGTTQEMGNVPKSNGNKELVNDFANTETVKTTNSPFGAASTTDNPGNCTESESHNIVQNGCLDEKNDRKSLPHDAESLEKSEVVESLYPKLQDMNAPGDSESAVSKDEKFTSQLQFPHNENLNSKVYLWNGDITKLSVQGLILPVYESLSKTSNLHNSLLYSAGPRLLQDCRNLSGLRTTDVRINHGYDLPARYAVHVVEPKYNSKFQSAADTALHTCYRSALQVCVEKELRTVAISPLHITRRGFPLIRGSLVALRTIRKCLEVLDSKFDAVVIVTDPTVVETYSKFLPAYFPRTRNEGLAQLELLPQQSLCNEWGEVLQDERAIRIADISHIKQENAEIKSVDPASETDEEYTPSLDQNLGPHAFSQMSGNHDEKRKSMLSNNAMHENLQSQERIYKRLLRIARNENFSQISALQAVKVSGYDVTVNRVVVIIGRMLTFSELDLEKFLLYLIVTFDSVVDEPYTIVYFHTETLDRDRPSVEYLKKLFFTVDQRYKSNLARLCLVHMNRLTRFRTWLNMMFFASDIRDRVINVKTIPDLYKIVPPNQIDVPPFVLNYDMRVNPQAYNSSPKRSLPNSRNQRDSDLNL